MAAQALYLKYRPRTFEEVVGQEAITRTLRNALRQGRVRHAYLFSGPRGTGKTTTARLLAKAVNCLAAEQERPCNVCSICVAINEGRLLDLIEIDAASNRGIDEIRDIREKVGFRPNEGRFKVYVLDEAHMLTEPAFNALLKTLEEPPPHVIFTLVTTDPHKIPATITSRCQRFDFRRIPLQAIVDRLAHIAALEGLTIEPAALEFIARKGTGALRDAISLLDQMTSYGDEITLEQVQMVLGTVSSEAASQLVACLASGDGAGGLDLINRAVGDGADPRQFGWEVIDYLRGLLLIKEGAGTRLLNATAEQAAEMESRAAQFSSEQLLRAIRLFNEAATDLKSGLQAIPQLPLEMALVESTLEPATPGTTVPPAPKHGSAQPEAGPRRIAESPAPPPNPEAQPAAAPAAIAEPQPPAASLSVGQVQDAWDKVLQAVRRRNPTTYGALNTECQAVEVNGNEIVITFPHPFLREKLNDPQRRTEIEEALGEVFGATQRARFVMASEYTPRPRPSTAPAADRTVPPSASELAEAPASLAAEGEVPEPISRWAAERGAQVKLVE
jgi:DNA polymerase-3 subunit gamma/tau